MKGRGQKFVQLLRKTNYFVHFFHDLALLLPKPFILVEETFSIVQQLIQFAKINIINPLSSQTEIICGVS